MKNNELSNKAPDQRNNRREEDLVLMPCDPSRLFAYWQISDEKASDLAVRIIRLYKHAANDKEKFSEIKIEANSGSWYIPIDESGKKWSAEVGFLDRNGSFEARAASGVIFGPEAGLSDQVDPQWSGEVDLAPGKLGLSSMESSDRGPK